MHSYKRTTLLALLASGAVGLTAPMAQAQVYELTREQSVRFDWPGLEPRLDWMRDSPRPIDKQSFREVDLERADGAYVYVRFLPGAGSLEREAAHGLAGDAAPVWEAELVPNLYRVRVNELDVERTIQRYLDHPATLYAEPSRYERVDQDDPFWANGSLYGLGFDEGCEAEFGWHEHQGVQDFVVAVIDSGLWEDHPDIAPNLWVNQNEIPFNGIDDDLNGRIDDITGWDFADNDNDPTPACSDHGQHVAGTVGARGNNGVGVLGVNWVCRQMNLRCEVANGDCDFLTDTLGAFNYAVANGATVSNHSYGGPTFQQAVFDSILASQAMGHVFVTSAGNSYDNTDITPQYPSCYNLGNIISVANMDEDEELYEVCDLFGGNCSGSSYGAATVDIGAPGTNIVSTSSSILGLGFYSTKTGTSMAAPHVAGGVALVRSKYPELEWWKAKQRVMTSARPNSTLSGKCVTGGTLDVARALGVWAGPVGGFGVGSKLLPFNYALDDTSFGAVFLNVPDYGDLHLDPGTIGQSAVGVADLFGFGDRPMRLRSTGGVVRIGG